MVFLIWDIITNKLFKWKRNTLFLKTVLKLKIAKLHYELEALKPSFHVEWWVTIVRSFSFPQSKWNEFFFFLFFFIWLHNYYLKKIKLLDNKESWKESPFSYQLPTVCGGSWWRWQSWAQQYGEGLQRLDGDGGGGGGEEASPSWNCAADVPVPIASQRRPERQVWPRPSSDDGLGDKCEWCHI